MASHCLSSTGIASSPEFIGELNSIARLRTSVSLVSYHFQTSSGPMESIPDIW